MNRFTELCWRIVFTIFFKGIYNVKFFYRERVPMTGSYIIAPNHVSNFDPPIVGLAIKRPTYFMAKAELFNNPIARLIITSLGAFPVRRGIVDKEAIRKAMDILKRGDLLGIFPQGTRRKPGSFDCLHDGVASIALRTGTPIVPVALIGTETLKRNNIAVVVGEPIIVVKSKPTKENIEEINHKISSTLKNLYCEGCSKLI